MCNIHTLYHACCQHYGLLTVSGPLCIRAASQPGHSRGCDYPTNLGIETVETLCPACVRKFNAALTPAFNTPASSLAAIVGMSRSASAGSGDSVTPPPSPLIRGEVGGSASPPFFPAAAAAAASAAGATTMPNLHWRSFGGSEASVRFKRDVR